VARSLPQDSLISVPEVHLHDSKENVDVLIMDDCGENALTLKQYLIEGVGTTDTVQKVCAELGNFLHRLHVQVSQQDEEFRSLMNCNTQAKQLSAWATYGRLKSTLDGTDSESVPVIADLGIAESDLKVAEEVSRATTDKMMCSTETVCFTCLL